MEILNCVVDETTLRAWREHFAPPAQPFFAREGSTLPPSLGAREDRKATLRKLPLSLHDTFATYEVDRSARSVVLLDEGTFAALPADLQYQLLQEQLAVGRGSVFRQTDYEGELTLSERKLLDTAAAGGPFVWWPSLFASLAPDSQRRVLSLFVTEDRPDCRRSELTAERWRHVDRELPGVRPLVGTFASTSGQNCLAAVVAAFTGYSPTGRLEREEFSEWLDAAHPKLTDPNELGAVLLWRDDLTNVQHAAVSLGQGLVFHKEAQTWWTPWHVVCSSEVMERWKHAGDLEAVKPSF